MKNYNLVKKANNTYLFIKNLTIKKNQDVTLY